MLAPMNPDGPDDGVVFSGDDIPGPDPTDVHERSVALIRRMDDGDLSGVGGLLGELAGPEDFAAQVVSLASLARLLLDQLPTSDDDAREAVLAELARVLIAAEGSGTGP